MLSIILGRTTENVILAIGPYRGHAGRQMYEDLRTFQHGFGHMEWISLELHDPEEDRIVAALAARGDNPMKALLLPNGEPLERRKYGRH